MSTAKISECGQYRYSLTREWGDGKATVCWLMLNPSTADAEMDDPTIRRCIGFSKAWGADRLEVVNLYAYRATDPKRLLAVADPIGPENDREIERATTAATWVVAAWGTKGGDRAHAVRRHLREHRPVFTLGLTKDGNPRHPLYVPSKQQPEVWEEPKP